MVIAGTFMNQGKLPIHSTILAAICGTICGISISYLLGRTAGHFLIIKYGKWIGLTDKRYQNTHDWFEKFGKWTLFIGYFIPCVRHLTGVAAGTTELSYKHFALYAYSGAVVWVSLFLSLGYFFGQKALDLYDRLELGIEIPILVIATLLAIAYIVYRKFRKK